LELGTYKPTVTEKPKKFCRTGLASFPVPRTSGPGQANPGGSGEFKKIHSAKKRPPDFLESPDTRENPVGV
jgi:hypothetical protein